jgi:integrase
MEMACLYHEKDRDTWRVIYNDGAGKRRTLSLGKVAKRQGEWWRTLVEELLHAQAAGGVVTKQLSDKVGRVSMEMLTRLANLGLIEPPTPDADMELGKVIDRFISLHEGEESTKGVIGRCRRHLVNHFGERRRIDTITKTDADSWGEYLTEKAELSKATKGRTVKTGKQIFKWAVKRDLIEKSPFEELKGNKSINPDRMVFVDRATIQKVIDHCPDDEWKLIIALSRYGGLRCPTEHLELKWSDINWERGVMTVRSPKTKRYPNGASRIVPLFKELRPFLDACFHDPEADSVQVISRYRRPNQNLRTQLERYIARAGVRVWCKLFQNLRASRATELKTSLPAHTAAKIMGHSIEVAASHYWQMTDADIDAALTVDTTPSKESGVILAVIGSHSQGYSEVHQGTVQLPQETVKAEKLGSYVVDQVFENDPTGTRTPVTAVKGRCPRPLDDGAKGL